MRSVRLASTLVVASIIVDACHHTPGPPYAATPEECRAARADERSGVIHIDGPRMNMPRLGDSLVLIVNDREAWRGVYDPCHPTAGHYAAALDHLIPATDSVVSFVIEHGPDVTATYHIGGRRPVAFVIRTAGPPE